MHDDAWQSQSFVDCYHHQLQKSILEGCAGRFPPVLPCRKLATKHSCLVAESTGDHWKSTRVLTAGSPLKNLFDISIVSRKRVAALPWNTISSDVTTKDGQTMEEPNVPEKRASGMARY